MKIVQVEVLKLQMDYSCMAKGKCERGGHCIGPVQQLRIQVCPHLLATASNVQSTAIQ